jgi:hypothetical protein
MKKEIKELEKYLIQMRESAEENKKNVIRKDVKEYYYGMMRGFDYALRKVQFYLYNK